VGLVQGRCLGLAPHDLEGALEELGGWLEPRPALGRDTASVQDPGSDGRVGLPGDGADSIQTAVIAGSDQLECRIESSSHRRVEPRAHGQMPGPRWHDDRQRLTVPEPVQGDDTAWDLLELQREQVERALESALRCLTGCRRRRGPLPRLQKSPASSPPAPGGSIARHLLDDQRVRAVALAPGAAQLRTRQQEHEPETARNRESAHLHPPRRIGISVHREDVYRARSATAPEHVWQLGT